MGRQIYIGLSLSVDYTSHGYIVEGGTIQYIEGQITRGNGGYPVTDRGYRRNIGRSDDGTRYIHTIVRNNVELIYDRWHQMVHGKGCRTIVQSRIRPDLTSGNFGNGNILIIVVVSKIYGYTGCIQPTIT